MKLLKFLLPLLLVYLSSCGYYKRFTYLQTIPPNRPDSLYNNSFTYYKLQTADILYVKIVSLDENITKMFNEDMGGSSSSSLAGGASGGMYISGFSIDKAGEIIAYHREAADIIVVESVAGRIQVDGRQVETNSPQARLKVEVVLRPGDLRVLPVPVQWGLI